MRFNAANESRITIALGGQTLKKIKHIFQRISGERIKVESKMLNVETAHAYCRQKQAGKLFNSPKLSNMILVY